MQNEPKEFFIKVKDPASGKTTYTLKAEDLGEVERQAKDSGQKVVFMDHFYSEDFFNKVVTQGNKIKLRFGLGENDVDYNAYAGPNANDITLNKTRVGQAGLAKPFVNMQHRFYKDYVAPIVTVIKTPNIGDRIKNRFTGFKAFLGIESAKKDLADLKQKNKSEMLELFKENLMTITGQANDGQTIVMPASKDKNGNIIINIGNGEAAKYYTKNEQKLMQDVLKATFKAINDGATVKEIEFLLNEDLKVENGLLCGSVKPIIPNAKPNAELKTDAPEQQNLAQASPIIIVEPKFVELKEDGSPIITEQFKVQSAPVNQQKSMKQNKAPYTVSATEAFADGEKKMKDILRAEASYEGPNSLDAQLERDTKEMDEESKIKKAAKADKEKSRTVIDAGTKIKASQSQGSEQDTTKPHSKSQVNQIK